MEEMENGTHYFHIGRADASTPEKVYQFGKAISFQFCVKLCLHILSKFPKLAHNKDKRGEPFHSQYTFFAQFRLANLNNCKIALKYITVI